MSTIVTKSSPVVVVAPSTTSPASSPATVEHIKLSSFDKALAFSPFTAFLIFDRTSTIPEPAATVRSALSRALVHYPTVAGRASAAAADAGGELRISCTGEGVLFVAASASSSLEDVKLFDPPFAGLLRDLAGVFPEETTCRPSDPLLLVQVTEFACGGFVVGATWNHALADGTGMAQLLNAVGELARGLPRPSVLPVVVTSGAGGDDLPPLPPLVAFIETMMVKLPSQGLVYQDITVPWTLVDRVRSKFAGAGEGGEPCTVFEAVVAVLWQCRTRVVMSESGDPAPLVFAANVRRHVGVRDGYFGNCVTSAVTVPRSGEVANGDVVDVVRIIKRAKQGIPGQFVKNVHDVDDVAGDGEDYYYSAPPPAMEQLGGGDVLFGYKALYVSSWRNLGFEAADMGGGTPARVMCHVELAAVPNCVACLPCRGKEGANVLALCVRAEHVDAFVAELKNFVV